ncbi:Pre-mRNA-splicing factor cwc26 [Tulasnella sp. 418]|nr:Pre-mRNA-splicing factor cwc26 [Tulasnella sp. 418]
MSGPKADAILARSSSSTGKKKKRKPAIGDNQGQGQTFIKDEDEELRWGKVKPQDEDDAMEEAVVEKSDRSFKKRKVEGESSGWITIKEPSPVDEQPMVVEEEARPAFTGGLVKASDLRSTLPQHSAPPSKKGKEKEQPPPEELETVYRDSSGRKIDTKAERAAAARERRVREEKEAQKMEWGKGVVQRAEAEERKREEEKERTRDLARYADDADLNAQQKATERWNDPAAAFLTKKEKKGPRKPTYNGPPPPPNRFGIPPGYRWDGVDRSNGFEKKMFQRANEKKRVGLEAYEWSVDDM